MVCIKKPPAVTSKDWNADLHELQNSDDSNLKELSESAIGANDRNLNLKTNMWSNGEHCYVKIINSNMTEPNSPVAKLYFGRIMAPAGEDNGTRYYSVQLTHLRSGGTSRRGWIIPSTNLMIRYATDNQLREYFNIKKTDDGPWFTNLALLYASRHIQYNRPICMDRGGLSGNGKGLPHNWFTGGSA